MKNAIILFALLATFYAFPKGPVMETRHTFFQKELVKTSTSKRTGDATVNHRISKEDAGKVQRKIRLVKKLMPSQEMGKAKKKGLGINLKLIGISFLAAGAAVIVLGLIFMSLDPSLSIIIPFGALLFVMGIVCLLITIFDKDF